MCSSSTPKTPSPSHAGATQASQPHSPRSFLRQVPLLIFPQLHHLRHQDQIPPSLRHRACRCGRCSRLPVDAVLAVGAVAAVGQAIDTGQAVDIKQAIDMGLVTLIGSRVLSAVTGRCSPKRPCMAPAAQTDHSNPTVPDRQLFETEATCRRHERHVV